MEEREGHGGEGGLKGEPWRGGRAEGRAMEERGGRAELRESYGGEGREG